MNTEVEIAPYLDKLEQVIDPEHIKRTSELQRRAFAFESIDHIPTHINYPISPDEWPAYTHQEIFSDPGMMLLNELSGVYASAKLQDDRLYGIRANYGTGIVSSLFGCDTRTFADTLPIGLHLPADKLDAVLEAGVPDVHSGLCGRALQTVGYFRDALKPYQKLSEFIGSQILDIQGPFDNATIIWGSELYLAVLDEPEKVDRLLDIVTQTIRLLVTEHRKIDGMPIDEHTGDWNWLGGLCIRNDSSINLSGKQYSELVKPYDSSLLSWIGGWIHFCGKAHQWWEDLLDISGLKGINPYQGEFYKLPEMYEKCKEARVAIVQWTVPLDTESRELVRTGMSRIAYAPDYESAIRMKEHLYKTGHVDI